MNFIATWFSSIQLFPWWDNCLMTCNKYIVMKTPCTPTHLRLVLINTYERVTKLVQFLKEYTRPWHELTADGTAAVFVYYHPHRHVRHHTVSASVSKYNASLSLSRPLHADAIVTLPSSRFTETMVKKRERHSLLSVDKEGTEVYCHPCTRAGFPHSNRTKFPTSFNN